MISPAGFVLLLANRAPLLGGIKRAVTAAYSSVRPMRSTYSQHGEDRWILEQLRGLDTSDAIYVDVGANHPTSISNTYLLYRHGHRGVVIEPNSELLRLHRWFRPGDIAVGAGCGAPPACLGLNVLSTPVLSSFKTPDPKLAKGARVLRVEHLPVLPLDVILEDIPHQWVSFVSIDTEGLDDEVLEGAQQTLTRTLLVCVEANDAAAERRVARRFKDRFDLQRRFGCNMIWYNRKAPMLTKT